MTRVLRYAVLALAVAALLGGCGDDSAVDQNVDLAEADAVAEESAVEPLEQVEPPKKAPNFTVQLAGGGETSLSDYEGRILVLDFWATSCVGCVKELPAFQELYESWDHEKVEYLAMSLDPDMAVIEGFLKSREDLDLPMALMPEETTDAYLGKTRTLPSAKVIDGEGFIRYEFIGKSADRVERAVQTLLEEDETAPQGAE